MDDISHDKLTSHFKLQITDWDLGDGLGNKMRKIRE